MENELKNIPLRAAPLSSDSENPKYEFLMRADIANESGTPAGDIGW